MKCRLQYCDDDARSRGLCPKHYRYFEFYGYLYMFPPTRAPLYVGCKSPGCKDKHSAKGYCALHYKKFFEAKYKEERAKRVCARCKKLRKIIARKLCTTCYKYLYNKCGVSKKMLENIKLAAQLSNIHYGVTAKIWHREFPELKKESCDRNFERVKALIRELGIPMEVKDGDRYLITLNFHELENYARNKFKDDGGFKPIPKEERLPPRHNWNRGKKLK